MPVPYAAVLAPAALGHHGVPTAIRGASVSATTSAETDLNGPEPDLKRVMGPGLLCCSSSATSSAPVCTP